MKYTYGFQEPLATRLEIAGGKGSNLSLLTQRRFPVPPGFIIGVQVYRDFIAEGSELLRGVETFHFDDPGRLRTESGTLRGQLGKLELPAEARVEVRERLKNFAPGRAFSVRSSSTMEDLASAAFAGQ